MKPQFLILSGDGINCELETRNAFELTGSEAKIVHINELLKNKSMLKKFHGLALPGGFSFGDELGSGQVLALKIKHGLYEEFYQFVENSKPIIGICNGFQVLTRLGVLPDHKKKRVLSLTHNSSGRFLDQWSELEVLPSPCLWTRNMKSLELPVRHGEGRVVLEKSEKTLISNYLNENKLIALKYKKDLNGSFERIAGLTNISGTILGLMPHPEAYMFKKLRGTASVSVSKDEKTKGDGFQIFQNINNYLNES